jgi:heme-degrading monooxygenase HmoA
MFTRVVEARIKAGRAKEFSTTLNDKVLPLLKKQRGLLEEITLFSTADPERVLALSFWQTEADATRYNTGRYPTVSDILRPVLETTPKIETFEVDTSTISKGKAA